MNTTSRPGIFDETLADELLTISTEEALYHDPVRLVRDKDLLWGGISSRGIVAPASYHISSGGSPYDLLSMSFTALF
ncbi:MAG: hypothetical protein AMR96_02885 [Candidatus Adiutrix intracellularis]|nr:MAG: hypothetical protein AMR96_02885 [Candidatus Adiutrix intracellularis]MDR2827003.1 hypothetical protein [Candidatus Adiutrix intracellularis]